MKRERESVISRKEALAAKRRRRQRRVRRMITLAAAVLVAVCAAVWAAYELGWFGPYGASDHAVQQDNEAGPSNGAGESADDADGEGTADGDEHVGEVTDSDDGGNAGEGRNADGEGEGDSGMQGPAEPERETITFTFVGDVMMAGNVGRLVAEKGYDYPFQHVADRLRSADWTVANLETSVTERGTPEQKQYTYRTSPKALPAIKDAGIDVVSLANNHVLDYGREGFLDTLDHLQAAEIGYVGAGRNEAEAYRPHFVETGGIRAAILGFSMVVPHVSWKAEGEQPGVAETYDYTRPVAAIEKAAEEADLVVVMVHWGEERNPYPNAKQKEMARRYIDAGADLVIGSHPHVLQGAERYKDRWIFYSLGNFVFTTNDKFRETWDTVILNASCTKDGECELAAEPVNNAWALPRPLEGDEANRVLSRLSEISINARVEADGRIAALDNANADTEGRAAP